MTKADIIAKLEEYKNRAIEIGISNDDAVAYSGIDGHWLFIDDNSLVEVKKNSLSGSFSTINQQQSPFSVLIIPFENVNYIRTYIRNEPDDIRNVIGGFTPVGDKSIDDIIKEIESDSVRKASSARGNLNVSDVNTRGVYGKFTGTAISTDIGGIPQYMKDDLLNNE